MGPYKRGPSTGERPREPTTGVARSSQDEGTLQTEGPEVRPGKARGSFTLLTPSAGAGGGAGKGSHVGP